MPCTWCKITAPKDLKAGTPVTLSAKASWLVCSDVCIPEDADLQLKLPASAAGRRRGSSGRRAVHGGARRVAKRAIGRDDGAHRRAASWSITLGKEWGATLAQIKSLDVLSL